METIRQLEAAGVSTEWGPNDAFAQALNKPEHRGHVRMFGRHASKSQVFGTSAESSTSATGSISSRPTPARAHDAAYDKLNRELVDTRSELEATRSELTATQDGLADANRRLASLEQMMSQFVSQSQTQPQSASGSAPVVPPVVLNVDDIS
ncbi:hypothetical protein LINPERPRIM_LOCUS22172, partial [Linum perenne]